MGYGAGRTLSPSKVSSPSREALRKSSPAHTPQVPSMKHAIDSFSQRPQKGIGGRLERGHPLPPQGPTVA